jgi:hypothetical protein
MMTLIYSNVDSDDENNNENDVTRMMEMIMMCDKVEFELTTGRRSWWKDDCERTENLSTTT